jgi:tetratricopeptide (TPR) repeat protein
MNCAESQDLLLDLAYGELEPARAAEVEAHVAGCATCRAEKAQIDRTRQMAAALRDPEEPSDKFDEPILRAARAEAGMQADGTPGPVVEVSASVKPLGLQAARLDPHARVRGSARQAPWWRRRATIIGSTAAAAALALVVSVSVTRQQQANRVEHEVAPITIRAPQLLAPQAVDEALTKREQRSADEFGGAGPRSVEQQPPAVPARNEAAPKKLAKAARPQEAAPPAKDAELARKKEAQRADEAKVVERDVVASKQPSAGAFATSAPPPSTAADAAAAPSSTAAAPERTRVAAAERSAPAGAREDVVISPIADARTAAPPAQAPPAMATGSVVGGTLKAPAQLQPEPPPPTADQIEDAATAARRAGDYARAAALYKQAAALRTQAAPARAAWDMAHAVECLAAGGNVAEAIETRKELLRTFPDQQGPRAAADSALRTVPLPPDQSTLPPK